MPQTMAVKTALGTMTLILIASCESQDRRLADYAQRATEQQARQNERMAQQAEILAKQSQEVTAAAHDLVEQDAAARRELIQAQDTLHQQIHVERVSLDTQRQLLDSERKAAANAAVRDPVVAQALIAGLLIVAALLPLLVTVYALRRLPETRPTDELLENALLENFITSEAALDFRHPPPTARSLFGPTDQDHEDGRQLGA
jgi:hypothetical protein